MPSLLYPKAKQKILQAQINWLTDNIKAALINDFYVVDLYSDDVFSDISLYVVNGLTPIKSLTNKIINMDGSVLADPTIFNSINPNQKVPYIIIFKDLDINNIDNPPNVTNCPLIALLDNEYSLGTNGGNIKFNWNPIKGIFRL
jgi:uncharacterized membrane protein